MKMSSSYNPAPEAKPKVESRPFPYAEAAARETGRREGETQAHAASEQHLAEIRESVNAALGEFARDRAQYYQQVETEVVQLTLAIARKILHREAQVDPLLLAGMVRITLEKIESATK